ncbi:MAG: hypothetical protein ACO3DD_03415, partial [Burkholderiaceae bacterium]
LSGDPELRFTDLVRDQALVQAAVSFGQQIASSYDDSRALQEIGVSQEAIDSLLSRWARSADDVLTSV